MHSKLILGLIGLFVSLGVAFSSAPATASPAETAAVNVASAPSATDATTPRAALRETFWCGGTFRILSTRTFGPSDWKQQLGVRDSDGARSVRVYHPSGRADRYRFKFMERDGSVWTAGAQHTSEWCVIVNPGIGVLPEADNGFGWKTGYWMNR